MKKAEFDAFAAEYAAMHEKSLSNYGSDTDYFADYKIADIARELDGRRVRAHTRRALDFGAGCGNSVEPFRRRLPDVALTCVDVSEESLAIGRAAHPELARFVLYDGTYLPLPQASIDVAFSACVFHHIAHEEHHAQLCQLHRVLRDDGLLFIFEHNPLNPFTRHVVNRCPFDANAHLIRAGVMKKRIEIAGFHNAKIRYRLFVPPSLKAIEGIERALTWLPVGAQYYVVAEKRSSG